MSCLENLNFTLLNNLDEIKENAKRMFVEKEEEKIWAEQGITGNETMNATKMMTPQQILQRQEKENEANTKLKDILKTMTVLLESVGFLNSQNKVYNLTKDLDHLPLVSALLTLNVLTQLTYDSFVYSLVRRNKESVIDGPHFIVGLITLFHQYHPSHYKRFLHFMAHFVKNTIYNAN